MYSKIRARQYRPDIMLQMQKNAVPALDNEMHVIKQLLGQDRAEKQQFYENCALENEKLMGDALVAAREDPTKQKRWLEIEKREYLFKVDQLNKLHGKTVQLQNMLEVLEKQRKPAALLDSDLEQLKQMQNRHDELAIKLREAMAINGDYLRIKNKLDADFLKYDFTLENDRFLTEVTMQEQDRQNVACINMDSAVEELSNQYRQMKIDFENQVQDHTSTINDMKQQLRKAIREKPPTYTPILRSADDTVVESESKDQIKKMFIENVQDKLGLTLYQFQDRIISQIRNNQLNARAEKNYTDINKRINQIKQQLSTLQYEDLQNIGKREVTEIEEEIAFERAEITKVGAANVSVTKLMQTTKKVMEEINGRLFIFNPSNKRTGEMHVDAETRAQLQKFRRPDENTLRYFHTDTRFLDENPFFDSLKLQITLAAWKYEVLRKLNMMKTSANQNSNISSDDEDQEDQFITNQQEEKSKPSGTLVEEDMEDDLNIFQTKQKQMKGVYYDGDLPGNLKIQFPRPQNSRPASSLDFNITSEITNDKNEYRYGGYIPRNVQGFITDRNGAKIRSRQFVKEMTEFLENQALKY